MSYIVPRDIPRGCEQCPFNGHTKCRIMPIGFDEYPLVGKRPDWCPLIEVETPHGNLVDRDKLVAKYDRQHKGPAGGARVIMLDAPAVIEAEDKAQGGDNVDRDM